MISSENSPVQVEFDSPRLIKTGSLYSKYKIRAIASYEVKARILSKKEYRYTGRGGDLSKYDLALGWGDMSNFNVSEKLKINQRGRWFYYRWRGNPPISPQKIRMMSVNTHTIAANKTIAKDLDDLNKNDLVLISGYLVNVKSSNGGLGGIAQKQGVTEVPELVNYYL